MKETKFKALMYCGNYIDANLLEKGIYACKKPFLYDLEESIGTLIEKGRKIQDLAGVWHISEEYFNNLEKCQLVEVFIVGSYGF